MQFFIRPLLLALFLPASQLEAADSGSKLKHPVADVLGLAPIGTVRVEGPLGKKLDLCMEHRVWGRDTDKIIPFFRNHNDNNDWRGEYWGKWFTAGVLAYAYQPTPGRLARLQENAREIIRTQDADGYLGTYDRQHRLSTNPPSFLIQ